jgi:hypothetical protein
MTVDEMVEALENGPVNYGPDDDLVLVPMRVANKAAAALRAGQTLAYKAEAYLNLTNPGWSRPQKELTDAIKTWGNATGDDK